MRKSYRKHSIITTNGVLTVKDWMRQNPKNFPTSNRIPTSDEIGRVLVKLGFNKTETSTGVVYQK